MNYDLNYRPASYWDTDGLLTGVWANIKGDARRNYIKALVQAGLIDRLKAEDLENSLPTEHRRAAGLVHPSLMGGEYLPDYLHGEVEIARIAMASVTRDVTSIRARPLAPGFKRIAYRVVDEYQSEYQVDRAYSLKPLTMGGLMRLMARCRAVDYQGLVFGFLDFSAECAGEADDYRDFLTVSSEFYPELEDCYSERIERWYRRWVARWK